MANTLLAATRKGLFVLQRGAAGWAIERHVFRGDSLSQLLVDPRDGCWYAALNLGHFGVKLQRSADRGISWEELAVPAYSETDLLTTGDGKPSQPATLKLLWSLETGGADAPGRLWAGTVPGGLFRSDDRGASWQLIRSLWDEPSRIEWFGGGYDAPGIHSICVDPRNSDVIRVAISSAGVWTSRDAGMSWNVTAHGMFAAYMPPDRRDEPIAQDPHRMVQCRDQPDHFWVQHHNGVFRSSDGAVHWQEVANVPPSVFGFAVAVHPTDPQTAWLVPAIKDECRIPVNGEWVVSRTRDGGQSFEVLRRGLPQCPAYDLVYRHGLIVDGTGECLAMGSTSGGLWTSDDQGDCWTELPARLPPIYALVFAD